MAKEILQLHTTIKDQAKIIKKKEDDIKYQQASVTKWRDKHADLVMENHNLEEKLNGGNYIMVKNSKNKNKKSSNDKNESNSHKGKKRKANKESHQQQQSVPPKKRQRQHLKQKKHGNSSKNEMDDDNQDSSNGDTEEDNEEDNNDTNMNNSNDIMFNWNDMMNEAKESSKLDLRLKNTTQKISDSIIGIHISDEDNDDESNDDNNNTNLNSRGKIEDNDNS